MQWMGDPSNFARILELYGHSHSAIAKDIKGYKYTDKEIKNCIKKVKVKCGYIPDPHGATAYMALSDFLAGNAGFTGVFLETAHPAKFSDTVEEALGEPLSIPQKLAEFALREKTSINISSKYPDFKAYLTNL
jgi:threonine synthase